jgi:hypothetical protein
MLIYDTIQSPGTPKLKRTLSALEAEARGMTQRNQVTQTDGLTADEWLAGMLYKGEIVDDTRPLMILRMSMVRTRDASSIEPSRPFHIGVRALLTKSRILFIDSTVNEMPTLENYPKSEFLQRAVAGHFRVSYVIEDDLWYYPIPLHNVTGLSFIAGHRSSANRDVKRYRHWASLLLWGVSALCLLMMFGGLENGDDALFGISLGIFLVTVIAGFLVYHYLSYYRIYQIQPIQDKSREIRIGVLDPVTQEHAVVTLDLEDSFSLNHARDWIQRLQQYAPHLAVGTIPAAHEESAKP